MRPVPLTHALLSAAGVDHGFGVRGAAEPPGVLRPRQVHGACVARVDAQGALAPDAADAVVSEWAGVGVAVATADCVPILAATAGGGAVAAIHAGWRGLAAGVVSAGLAALRDCASATAEIRAVVGPCIGPCCYEVDEPVLRALRRRFGASLDDALRPNRPGHAMLDLARLVGRELEAAGLSESQWAALRGVCTRCDPTRFHSYRRDGARAGRLLHFIVPRSSSSRNRPRNPKVDRADLEL